MMGVIVGIDNSNNKAKYRLLAYTFKNNEWQFNKQMVNEEQLLNILNNKKINITNVKVENRKIKGRTGDLSRFENNVNKPLVILAEILHGDELIGYRVADFNGVVKGIKLTDMIGFCERVSKNSGIPIQNGIFVPCTDAGQKAHIRCYPDGDYIKEVLKREKTQYVKPASVDTDKNTKSISKLEELFSPEQIRELMIGKKNGVSIKIYGNNKLSAEQMRVIRESLEDGLNAKLFASPEYSVESMSELRAYMKYGVDVEYFLNPKYTAEQLSEVSSGFMSGVDINKFANPNIPASEMSEIRVRLEANLWKEHEARADSSWN